MTEAFQEAGKGRSFGVVLLFLYERGVEGIWPKKPGLFFHFYTALLWSFISTR